MKTECTNCHQHYEVDEEYLGQEVQCTQCGQTFVVKVNDCERGTISDNRVKRETYCNKCGAEVGVGDVFCGNCGTKLQDAAASQEAYFAQVDSNVYGPMFEEKFINLCEEGIISPTDIVWTRSNPGSRIRAAELVDFSSDTQSQDLTNTATTSKPPSPPTRGKKQRVYSEEVQPVLGESFACPYCRTVSPIDDVLSVSVSPALLGDPVLGEYEQSRFLPTQFTSNGLAVDSEGGVCTETACPVCHMAFSQELLNAPQIVMSVIGTSGAGKSVFLASSIWRCRHVLPGLFGVRFMDLDPVANRWINAYEEKFFFQGKSERLQQIAKTDMNDTSLTRSVSIDGEAVLLPLPSFFQTTPRGMAKSHSLVVYDSAGEHFGAGEDRHGSFVTLNMLNADVLYFMFDPSADPRFEDYLNRGSGTAENTLQRQDTLIAEMAARIRRHYGTRYRSKLDRPLIFGVSKADLLREHLNLEAPVYRKISEGRSMLDLKVLKEVSDSTESFLAKIVPEVVATVRDIATEVWFLPVSALGHNPQREGVRPMDIKPVWAELPIVFTLARRGLVEIYSQR